jgi:uncharacterized protein
MARDEVLHVSVAYCPRLGSTDLTELQLSVGSTLGDALAQSGVLQRHALVVHTVRAGIWGKAKPLDTPLRDKDRVEIYRPLLVDPKEARRQRYQRHKEARSVGKP